MPQRGSMSASEVLAGDCRGSRRRWVWLQESPYREGRVDGRQWAVSSGQAQKTQAGNGLLEGPAAQQRARVVAAPADAAAANANAAGFGRALALA